MRFDCATASPYTVPGGQIVGQGEKKALSGGVVFNQKDLLREIDDSPVFNDGKLFSGYLSGCVIYRTELSRKDLHSAFFYEIGGRLTPDFLKELDSVRNNVHVTPLAIEPSQFNFFPDAVNGYSD